MVSLINGSLKSRIGIGALCIISIVALGVSQVGAEVNIIGHYFNGDGDVYVDTQLKNIDYEFQVAIKSEILAGAGSGKARGCEEGHAVDSTSMSTAEGSVGCKLDIKGTNKDTTDELMNFASSFTVGASSDQINEGWVLQNGGEAVAIGAHGSKLMVDHSIELNKAAYVGKLHGEPQKLEMHGKGQKSGNEDIPSSFKHSAALISNGKWGIIDSDGWTEEYKNETVHTPTVYFWYIDAISTRDYAKVSTEIPVVAGNRNMTADVTGYRFDGKRDEIEMEVPLANFEDAKSLDKMFDTLYAGVTHTVEYWHKLN